jgi:hypothetical protein
MAAKPLVSRVRRPLEFEPPPGIESKMQCIIAGMGGVAIEKYQFI